MGTDTRGNETKDALLRAAQQLVEERGYAGATIRELAAASGASQAAVNYHFGSRENLLNQAILDSFLEWTDRVGKVGAATVGPEAEPLQQLAARARPTVEGFAEARPRFVIGLEALLQSARSPELKRQLAEHYAEQRRQAGEFIAASDRGREIPPRMIEVVSSFMLAVADGLQLQALVDPDAIPTGDELAALYEGLAASARAQTSPTPEADANAEPDPDVEVGP